MGLFDKKKTTDTTSKSPFNYEAIDKDMEKAGIKKDPFSGVYTQVQRDDFLKNKQTDKQVVENKANGVNQGEVADKIAKTITDGGAENANLTIEQNLDESITSDNPEQKAAAEDYYSSGVPSQKHINELAGVAPLEETDKENAQAQSDIEEAVASGAKTPQEVLQSTADKYGFGLIRFNDKGEIVLPDAKVASQWKTSDTSGKLAMIGTVLSCIVCALSGGNIPPINFNKIAGVDKQYTTYVANVHQFNQAIASGLEKEANNIANADYASYMAKLPESERRIVENVSSEYEYTKAAADKERIEAQGKISKEMQNAMITAGITQLIELQNAYDKGLITKETFDMKVKQTRSDMGKYSPDTDFGKLIMKYGIRANVGGPNNNISFGAQ